MKFTLRSSFARYVVTLFVSVIALTVAGRIVTLSDAAQFCAGWPLCIPSAPVGWLKLAHLSLVGIASVLVALVFRKAWREQRSHRLILPLTTILGVMFFGQALVGAALISQSEARHLFVRAPWSAKWKLKRFQRLTENSALADWLTPESGNRQKYTG